MKLVTIYTKAGDIRQQWQERKPNMQMVNEFIKKMNSTYGDGHTVEIKEVGDGIKRRNKTKI